MLVVTRFSRILGTGEVSPSYGCQPSLHPKQQKIHPKIGILNPDRWDFFLKYILPLQTLKRWEFVRIICKTKTFFNLFKVILILHHGRSPVKHHLGTYFLFFSNQLKQIEVFVLGFFGITVKHGLPLTRPQSVCCRVDLEGVRRFDTASQVCAETETKVLL